MRVSPALWRKMRSPRLSSGGSGVYTWVRLGRDGYGGVQDLRFSEEPIVKVVAVLAVAFHTDFKRKTADLFFKIWMYAGGNFSGYAFDWVLL